VLDPARLSALRKKLDLKDRKKISRIITDVLHILFIVIDGIK